MKMTTAFIERSAKALLADLQARDAAETTAVKTITFEDQGQDFLEWDLDAEGNVIACRPFQADLWTRHAVRNHERVSVGGYAVITSDNKPLAIKYPLVKVTSAH